MKRSPALEQVHPCVAVRMHRTISTTRTHTICESGITVGTDHAIEAGRSSSSSCHATPVYQGGTLPGPADVPWVQAQPTSSGIVGHLFYAQGAATKSGTYRFLHTGGRYPYGSTTKILWMVDHPQAQGPLQIDGTNQSAPGKTFHQTIEGEAEIPSIVVVPSAGCWRLHVASGQAVGAITMWVVGS